MQRRKKGKLSRTLFVMAGWLFAGGVIALGGQAAVPDYMHVPVVEEGPGTPSGLVTTWSCVWFGNYPSAEVVDSEWNAVDSYALQDGDLIRDDGLYEALEAAEWQDDDTLTLEEASYIRVKPENAGEEGESREQHYRMEDTDVWHYFQVQPIRWRVLDIREGRALLLADRMIDSRPFHDADENVVWAGSTLRSWLNGYGAEQNLQGTDFSQTGFWGQAFTESEQKAIVPVTCRNLPNQDYGTDSGPDTQDRIFILSNEEVFEGENAGSYGFYPGRDYDDASRRFTSTLYAKFRGAFWSPVEAYAGNSFWFMRTSGYNPVSVTYICDFGFVYSKGTLATCSDAGILPAMWIDLSLAVPEDAGETRSTDIMRTGDNGQESASKPEAAAFDLANPVIEEDSDMPGGRRTVWNAVAFGHYPQTQIVEKPDGEEPAAGNAGGTEVDARLYRNLEQAAAGSGNEIVVDDTRYVRLDGRWFRYDPIIWRVLDVSDGTALLLSDRCLDSVPYHAEYEDVFWEESDLRAWLNGKGDHMTQAQKERYGEASFLERAFSQEEQEAILRAVVPNANNYYFGTACGSGTHDKVFLLSEEEVFSSSKAESYGFRPDDATADPGRRIAPTAYAISRGVWTSEKEETAGNVFWLLRTNGYTRDNVVYVGEKGYLYNRGIPVTCPDAGIVPAIRVRLGKAQMTQVSDISCTK